MIVRWLGMQKGAVVKGFYDNTDLTPTVQELLEYTDVFGSLSL